MPLAHTGELIEKAVLERTGLAAFNVIGLEHGEAIVAAAEQVCSPVVLQVSENCIRYHGDRLRPLIAALGALAQASSASVSIHLDHIEDSSLLDQARGTQVSSVMFDASRLAYSDNVAATKSVAQWAHAQGWHVEAELGEVGGKDGAHAPGVRTDPFEAARFVAATAVDSLAVAVGSSHAMTKRTACLDHYLIGAIRREAAVPLVLHGSSGVPDEELAAAVSSGIVKVNVGTILNVAFTAAVRESLGSSDSVDPRRYLAPARHATRAVAHRLLMTIAQKGHRLAHA